MEEKNVIVEKPLTWDDVNAIPIANPSMSTDELRKICVDFIKLSVSFRYKPSENYLFKRKPYRDPVELEKGKLYGGIPYVSVGSGNLYRIIEHYDSKTGVLDVSPFYDYHFLGNACSGAGGWAWMRVVNSVIHRWTSEMTQANGYLKVGPYEYDLTVKEFSKEYSHSTVKLANGEQIMFQSYAQTLPADGIVNSDHVRMVTGNPVVVKNEDGTINGEESYLPCSEQTSNHKKPEKFQRVQSDGTEYLNEGVESYNYTFAELFKASYLPFTFAELVGKKPVDVAEISLDYKGESITPDSFVAAKIHSNYMVGDLYLTVKDQEGKVLYRAEKFVKNFRCYNRNVSDYMTAEELVPFAESGNNTFELYCRVGNGQKLLVYQGTLVSQ